MDIMQQPFASTSNESQEEYCPTSKGSPSLIKCENCSDLFMSTIKVEPHESGETSSFRDDLNYVLKNPDNIASIISKNTAVKILPSQPNVILDVKPFYHLNPIARLTSLKIDVKEPLKITKELVNYHLKSLDTKREDSSCDATERTSLLLSKNVLDCNKYNYSDQTRNTNERNEKENVSSELTLSHPDALSQHGVSDKCNAESERILTCTRSLTSELVCYHTQKESEGESNSCNVRENSAPPCLNLLPDGKDFSCSNETIATMKLVTKIKKEENITDEKNCDDKSLLKVLKLEENDKNENNDQSPEFSLISGFSNETQTPTLFRDDIKLEGLFVILEDLFQQSLQGTNQKFVHTSKKTCFCIFCVGNVKVKSKSSGVLEVTSSTKPSERLVFREKPLTLNRCTKWQPFPKLRIENTNKCGKLFVCSFCPEKFEFKKDLLKHLNITHPDEKPYKCIHCLKKYKFSSALYNHRKIHLNNQRFQDEGSSFIGNHFHQGTMRNRTQISNLRVRT